MITLSGKLYNVATGENKDRQTGEITPSYSAEIIHTVRGKSEIASVKLDSEVVTSWGKCIGKDISCEVRFYAMKSSDGGINSGLTLADKKCLPILTVSPDQLKKAA